MNLNDITNGSTVFIDTNVLIYARRGHSVQCRQLLSRCNARAVNGVISGLVVVEFCHRRMMQEAQASVVSRRTRPRRSRRSRRLSGNFQFMPMMSGRFLAVSWH